MFAATWLILSGLLYSLQLQTGSFPRPLTEQEEKHYLALSAKGDLNARNILIERNLRLVAHIMKKYYAQTSDQEDLISIGTIGLIKGITTFDHSKGARLATYAARCIENEILMLLRSKRKLSREVSLYEPIGTDRDGNEIQLYDIIESNEDDACTQITLKENIKLLYQKLESLLSPRERLVLKMRYGLYDQEEYTQREVAKQLVLQNYLH